MQEYKGNSHRAREQAATPPEKKIEKVVDGDVRAVKKSSARKFADIFIPEDVANVKSFIFMDILVPSLKKVALDALEFIFYGDTRGRAGGISGTGSKVSYRSYYDKGQSDKGTSRAGNLYRGAIHEYDEYTVGSRREAMNVLAEMDNLIRHYGLVSVADYCGLLGREASWNDEKWGWTDLRNAYTEQLRDGRYIVRLPKATPLD